MSNHKDPLEMMTLIGVRCTRGNTFSRDVLIDQVFLSSDGGREGGLESRNNLLSRAIPARDPEAALAERIYVFTLDLVFWWFNGGATPVLIPNTEVKLASGDGTGLYRPGE